MISLRLLRAVAGLNQNIYSASSTTVSMVPSWHDGVIPNTRDNSSSLVVDSTRQMTTLAAFKRSKLSSELLEAEAQLPPRPKRPRNPWLTFLHGRKYELIKENGPMTVTQLSSALAKEWRQIDKSRYELEYRQNLLDYHRAVESYELSLTDEQRSVIEQRKNLKREAKDLKNLKRTKPPVLPRNPVSIYCSERFKDPDIQERMKTSNSALILRDLTREYKDLDDSSKRKYIELQQQDKLRFRRQFDQWYDGVKFDPRSSRAIRDKADAMRRRFETLHYI